VLDDRPEGEASRLSHAIRRIAIDSRVDCMQSWRKTKPKVEMCERSEEQEKKQSPPFRSRIECNTTRNGERKSEGLQVVFMHSPITGRGVWEVERWRRAGRIR
jgi:hypothetical protein